MVAQSNKIPEAIAVLEKLVAVDPKRSRELYTRMAGYAQSVYQDADAIRYQTKAVELNPDDAESYRKLGDLYKAKRDNVRAIAAYRQALTKNERLYPVYFLLAQLLADSGQVPEADRLLRKVIRSAPDDELVVAATRQALQLHSETGTEQSLEEDLLPMALSSPQRPVFRKLLVQVYGTLESRWNQQVHEGHPGRTHRGRGQAGRHRQTSAKSLARRPRRQGSERAAHRHRSPRARGQQGGGVAALVVRHERRQRGFARSGDAGCGRLRRHRAHAQADHRPRAPQSRSERLGPRRQRRGVDAGRARRSESRVGAAQDPHRHEPGAQSDGCLRPAGRQGPEDARGAGATRVRPRRGPAAASVRDPRARTADCSRENGLARPGRRAGALGRARGTRARGAAPARRGRRRRDPPLRPPVGPSRT